MRRLTLLATTLLLCSCGGDDGDDNSASVAPCDSAPLSARQVIGPTPPGYQVVRGDRQAMGQYAGQLRRAIGDAYRSYDGRVLVERGASDGTVVLVINTYEAGAEDAVAGAKYAERENGIVGRPISVDAREGRLQEAKDGSFIAMAPAGECSVVLLVSLQEPLVREAAALIGSRR
jgi:hypothetical protein